MLIKKSFRFVSTITETELTLLKHFQKSKETFWIKSYLYSFFVCFQTSPVQQTLKQSSSVSDRTPTLLLPLSAVPPSAPVEGAPTLHSKLDRNTKTQINVVQNLIKYVYGHIN